MKLLSVGLTGATDEIRVKLQKDCVALAQEGFQVAIDETSKGNYTFLGCNVVDGELSFRSYERIKQLLKDYVAQIVSELIVADEEKNIIRKIINQNYHYFNEEERTAVYENTLKALNGNKTNVIDFCLVDRRKQILSRLTDYLDHHHELVVEGFINFRLKDYREELVHLVDDVVEDFMMELEYKEFIRVLRYFVDIQEPQADEVHIVIDPEGVFKIIDTAGNSIHNQYLESYISQSADEINYGDLLVTALITLAPQEIVLHGCDPQKTQDTVEIIKNIFEGRVTICKGCSLCRPYVLGNITPDN
ncbi:putative sporulation protein YtxC [Propionispora vibrioides]|uniref:Putative sporulation protein YtxC n=1 Tax=Propionispora vibrioides TaxID=112903 RepID=A0A1H8SGF9_9FIRM|nr:putative sporulation protein YtxC [Propionispora vibrioides]SEO77732.1 putative sporulation protein YtxC [Propionispora vibrioides]